jgi:hypothetical protein
MKTKLLIAVLVLAQSAYADLIDFTPGGFQIQQTPGYVQTWLDSRGPNNYLFDVAVLNYPGHGTGWVGNGFIPGGTYFNTNLFSFQFNPTTCTLSWNFAGAANWELSWIWVQGIGTNYWNHIYQVPINQLLNGQGSVELNGVEPIYSIGFFGQHINFESVPDTGSTLLLLGVACGIFYILRPKVSA